eukprot:1160129-Pelagomonas_calceolata.AAC.3
MAWPTSPCAMLAAWNLLFVCLARSMANHSMRHACVMQLVDGMNNNFMRRVDTIDDQLLGLYERAGTLPGQVPPRSGPQSGVDCARREKQMADSIMENLMAEVGPGLETSLHDAEQALEIADETRADLEVVRGVVGKMGKKVSAVVGKSGVVGKGGVVDKMGGGMMGGVVGKVRGVVDKVGKRVRAWGRQWEGELPTL